MKAKRIIVLILFSLSFATNVLAQNSQPVHLPSHEKIYIHFDKPYYSAGETIWYKAYLYNNGLPSPLSNELYLQLEDKNGKIIDKKRYPVSGAAATGSIVLDTSLPQGYYTLRAITKAIMEDDAEFAYSKHLFIYNAAGKTNDTLVKKNISLQFFPESGQLVDKINTQVAFKATDERGLPVNVHGLIKSDSGVIITAFKTFHDGIGKLLLTPHLEEVFFAELEVDGISYRFPLPAVQASGVYLKITEADSGKIFEITRSKKDRELFDTVRLLVKMNSDTVFESLIPFGYEQVVSSLLKTGNIPSGIVHFIVLNKFNVPLAERLSFVNNKEYLSVPELIMTKRDSSKRGPNSFELQFPDTVQRSLSIAVTDLSVQEFPDKENIYSGLLLTSDLKGYVYNPAFYFEKDDAATRLALDNLMLTHGWTRYNTKKKTGNATGHKTGDDHYLLLIAGSVNELNSGKPVSNGTLNLQIVTDSAIQVFDVLVDKNGRFGLDSLLFFGNARIYYSYKSGTGKKIPVSIMPDKDRSDEPFLALSKKQMANMFREKTGNEFNGQLFMVPNQFLDGKFKQLNTVFLKSTIKRPEDIINEKYATGLFSATGKLVLDNINTPYNNKSLDVINYVLDNIQTLAYDPDFKTLVNKKNFSIRNQKNWKVGLFVNENMVNVENAKSITMDRVALIKFYEAGFVGVSTETPGGAVAIYLKDGESEQLVKDMDKQKYLSYTGYTVTQEFYHPDYTVSLPENMAPDNRLTLYWAPVLSSGTSSRESKFGFFNNDFSKKLSIVVEGFDAHGRLLHLERSL